MPESPILYFDGVCGLCNRFVDWMLARDRAHRFRFAPIQGETAAVRLPARYHTDPSTLVLDTGGQLADRSTAVLRAVAGLGGPWRLLSALRLVPPPLRNAVYDWVATNRYAWFGKRAACRLPTAEERGSFLP